MARPQIASDEKPFAAAEEKFAELGADLLSENAANMSHGEAEEFVLNRG